MDPKDLKKLLRDVRSGKVEVGQAMERLRRLPYDNLGFCRIDSHRALRRGHPEVIFGLRKTPEQVVAIADRMVEHGTVVLITRCPEEAARILVEKHPRAEHYPQSACLVISPGKIRQAGGLILVISAGTADIPVAEEAAVTARVLGNRVEVLYDAGVAGLHRLLSQSPLLEEASVIVVVAGMEGALPSVVAGLVDVPVIAVPTSVGYGAGFNGLAPLLGMLNSCSEGVTVVNIDNGFGAGYAAGLINRPRRRRKSKPGGGRS